MLQAIVKKGRVFAERVPEPRVSPGSVLIKVVNSCISAGTELSGVQSSGRGLIRKILDQPALIHRALNLMRSEGVARTVKKIQSGSKGRQPTGYSLSGEIVAIGEGVRDLTIGDAVAAAGAGIANHAEYVDVPVNLVVRIPKGVGFAEASTVALGAIALQGVRRCEVTLGEICVVVGTGFLGLLSIQMLRRAGVRVAALDIDESRLRLARQFGAELIVNPSKRDGVHEVDNLTGGFGADAVLFTASTMSNEPMSHAFKMCKKKGRVVLVGVAGLHLNRDDMFAKELDLRLSTSYGPGRYDSKYEEKGMEYPYAYVRWTENRNMSEYLRLLATRDVKLENLIERVYAIERVHEAFASLTDEVRRPIAVILRYGDAPSREADRLPIVMRNNSNVQEQGRAKAKVIRIGLVGAGAFATSVHLPNIARLRELYRLEAVVDSTGLKARTVADEYGAKIASSDVRDILGNDGVDLVMITTRHDSHASLVLEALRSGKHVFVEKPLATNLAELEAIKKFYRKSATTGKPLLMVGFNRRFSKYAEEIKKHTDERTNPLFIHYRVNAGYVSPDHWVHDSGGRIVGEVCHMIDLMTFLTNAHVESISHEALRPSNERHVSDDNKSIILKYRDGSLCTIHYFTTGSKDFPKEYMEVHFDGKTIEMNDYRRLRGFGVPIHEIKSARSEKGHLEELRRLHGTLVGEEKAWPIDLWDMIQTTEITFNLA